ncbi:MAG: PDDEXK nuclease domain-containing protein [Gracilibacteraceae bacterium]|nr:PDDEXK nuclease domain-containing protein [Gracilibacteraceae bacterium]
MTKYKDAVLSIKNAILQSRYQAARLANREQLMLYYSIGRYVSDNTRSGKWGTGAIEEISRQLQGELPGLRGFSATTMKYMRTFFETWSEVFEQNRPLTMDDLNVQNTLLGLRPLTTDEMLIDAPLANHHLPSDELEIADLDAFMRVGFTHHREILMKCQQWEGRWYYIKRCAAEFWSVEKLKKHIRDNDFTRFGALPNNFALTIPDAKQVAKAVRSFKDEYLLDFINIEDEDDPELIDERVLERGIIANVKEFIEKFGEGFCYIGNQYRVIFDEQEFFCDILFFSRNLNCLVAIELKRGIFKPFFPSPWPRPPQPPPKTGCGKSSLR